MANEKILIDSHISWRKGKKYDSYYFDEFKAVDLYPSGPRGKNTVYFHQGIKLDPEHITKYHLTTNPNYIRNLSDKFDLVGSMKHEDIIVVLRSSQIDLTKYNLDRRSTSDVQSSSSETLLFEFVSKFINDYQNEIQNSFANNAFGNYVRKTVPDNIFRTGIVNNADYLITGSVGQGNWAQIPWVAIFNRSVTKTAQKGQYIVYLRARNGDLYLTFNQGCTDLVSNLGKKGAINRLRQVAEKARQEIDNRGFSMEPIDLQFPTEDKAQLYEAGNIFSKKYAANSIPSEDILRDDLRKMVEIYEDFISSNPSGEDEFVSPRNAWLLTWNPEDYPYDDYEEQVNDLKNGKTVIEQWACANSHVKIGDRVFFMRLGTGEKNGILASGYATRESFIDEHYNQERAASGETVRYIEFKFDIMLDRNGASFLTQERLISLFPNQHWSPQGSGIAIKQEYVEALETEWMSLNNPSESENNMDRATVEKIKNFITNKGFSYPDGLIENFCLSLKSKPFVILAGTSGTGKTKLVSLFAKAIGAKYKLIPVRPDWSDSSDLFGHMDLNGNYIPGELLSFIKEADNNREKPYVLCLDEMNLARVEYYLSDFLSVIETREFVGDEIVSQPLLSKEKYGGDENARALYGELCFPSNLYIVGTVNMDETTFPFSKKVLDRANTIEFNYVDLIPEDNSYGEVLPESLDNRFLKTNYLLFAQCNDAEYAKSISVKLQEINEILRECNAHVGYRVRDEIVFYMLNNKDAGLLSEDEAFDNEIMQKILPRLQGSSQAVKEMLCNLFRVFAGDFDYQPQNNDVSRKMMNKLSGGNIKYPKSAEKIAFMVRRYEEDGFTSYWL